MLHMLRYSKAYFLQKDALGIPSELSVKSKEPVAENPCFDPDNRREAGDRGAARRRPQGSGMAETFRRVLLQKGGRNEEDGRQTYQDEETKEWRGCAGKAVEYCIGNGILEDFLKKHRAEAIEMWYDFDAERYLADEKKWFYEQGVEQGMERGRQQGVEQKTCTVIRNMLAQGMSDEDILSLVECTPDLIRRIRTETDENAVTVK